MSWERLLKSSLRSGISAEVSLMGKLKSASRGRADWKRDSGGFVALPRSVLNCEGFKSLSHPAKALLLELAYQYRGDNNGRLLLTRKVLGPRGWNSVDVIHRAKEELLSKELIFETVKGRRPNRASWYAITWYTLDQHWDFDPGAREGFRKGAYRRNDGLCPAPGSAPGQVAPRAGAMPRSPAPEGGAIRTATSGVPAPLPGHPLENHLLGAELACA